MVLEGKSKSKIEDEKLLEQEFYAALNQKIKGKEFLFEAAGTLSAEGGKVLISPEGIIKSDGSEGVFYKDWDSVAKGWTRTSKFITKRALLNQAGIKAMGRHVLEGINAEDKIKDQLKKDLNF